MAKSSRTRTAGRASSRSRRVQVPSAWPPARSARARLVLVNRASAPARMARCARAWAMWVLPTPTGRNRMTDSPACSQRSAARSRMAAAGSLGLAAKSNPSRPEFRRWWAFGGLCRGVVAGRGLVVCHGSQFGVGTRCVACRSTSQQVECLGVGVYLREARRRNRDGTTVSYLQLAHNQRHPVTGASTAKVIHSFGRAETVDRAGLARLVASISRFLDPQQAVAAAAGAEVEVVDSRRLGGARSEE